MAVVVKQRWAHLAGWEAALSALLLLSRSIVLGADIEEEKIVNACLRSFEVIPFMSSYSFKGAAGSRGGAFPN